MFILVSPLKNKRKVRQKMCRSHAFTRIYHWYGINFRSKHCRRTLLAIKIGVTVQTKSDKTKSNEQWPSSFIKIGFTACTLLVSRWMASDFVRLNLHPIKSQQLPGNPPTPHLVKFLKSKALLPQTKIHIAGEFSGMKKSCSQDFPQEKTNRRCLRFAIAFTYLSLTTIPFTMNHILNHL